MRKTTLLIFLITPILALSQQLPPDSILSAHYIEPMAKFITLKLTQSSDIETLGITNESNKIDLRPNTKTTTRLAFSYRFISFSIKFSPKFLPGNDDDAIRGKSKIGGFGFGFNFRHWQQELSYTRTKGYYLENTKDYNPGWTNGQPYVQFPDLVYTSLEGITAYNFNPNYSVSAVATQSTRQLKSAGSFMPIALYRYYKTDDKTPITGSHITQMARNFEFLVGAGYHYTFVAKESFYISAGLTPGVGYVFSNISTRSIAETQKTTQNNAIFRIEGRAGIGYNGPRFFTGAYMRISASSYKQENSAVVTNNDRVIFQGFIGYRLFAPKWMQKDVEKIAKKAGIK